MPKAGKNSSLYIREDVIPLADKLVEVSQLTKTPMGISTFTHFCLVIFGPNLIGAMDNNVGPVQFLERVAAVGIENACKYFAIPYAGDESEAVARARVLEGIDDATAGANVGSHRNRQHLGKGVPTVQKADVLALGGGDNSSEEEATS